ncbi:MAG: alpha/beta hydrolase [Pseudomonadales bacterium]|nr:alpha/beta hydrolase [Pseudomonadales bacterium]
MQTLLTRHELETPDGNISYLKGPDRPGAPYFHLLQATGFNAQTYRQLLIPLCEHLNVFATDLRGHGLGTIKADPSEFNSWDIYREDFYRMLDHINHPVYLMGHSVGSIISIAGAVKRPELVKGLILVEGLIPPTVGDIPERPYNPIENPLPEAARNRRSLFPSREEAVNSYIGRGAFKTWGRSWIEDYIDGGTRLREDGQVELSCAPAWEARSFETAENDPWEKIEQLSCPTLLMYADKHSTCNPSGVEKYKRLQPDTKAYEVADTTHFLPIERPELVRQEILKMIERVETRPTNAHTE